MWVIVMFDLPVVEKAERKAATDFRNALLDMGFEMSQFSVYLKTNFPVKTPPFREEPGWGGVFAAPSQPLSER